MLKLYLKEKQEKLLNLFKRDVQKIYTKIYSRQRYIFIICIMKGYCLDK